MDHATIIARLGGYERVAQATGRHRSRAHRWQTDGIPMPCWPAVIRLAAEHGLSITADDLLRHAPQGAVADAANATHQSARNTADA